MENLMEALGEGYGIVAFYTFWSGFLILFSLYTVLRR